jgi:predicted ATP-grasp superfamily ATP-dependent carboligase
MRHVCVTVQCQLSHSNFLYDLSCRSRSANPHAEHGGLALHVNVKRRRAGDNPKTPYACVIGEIDLLRALALADIPCALVAPRGDFARYSRGARIVIDLPEHWQAPDLVERLIRWGELHPVRPALFYDGDWDLLMISEYRERLRPVFRFVVPEHELVLDLVDKARFARLATTHDLPVPRAVQLAPGDSTDGVDFPFPVVVKPITRHLDSWQPLSTAKAMQADTRAELDAAWAELSRLGLRVLVQEMIPGPERLIESYHAYVDAAGATVGEFTGRKIRTYPAAHGYSTSLESTDAPDVLALGRDVLARIGFREGVAKLDFKRHPETGTLHLFEINPRFNLWHHLGAKAGVNLAHAVYADLTGAPRPRLGVAVPGKRWCNLSSDARAARAEGMSLARWIPWALRSDAKHGVAWNDPFPVVAGMLQLLVRRRIAKRPTGSPT